MVRERSAKPLCVGSIPTRASNLSLQLLVWSAVSPELTFRPGCARSFPSPSWWLAPAQSFRFVADTSERFPVRSRGRATSSLRCSTYHPGLDHRLQQGVMAQVLALLIFVPTFALAAGVIAVPTAAPLLLVPRAYSQHQ